MFENFDIKRILSYIIKTIILFLILYFTFVDPTGLVLLYYVYPSFYKIIYILILFAFAKIFAFKFKKKNFFTKHILNLLFLVVGVAICCGVLTLVNFTNDKNHEKRINNFINNADEIIYYNLNVQNYSGFENDKILHPGNYTTDTILINYKTKKVAFLLTNFSVFTEFQLTEGGISKNKHVQSIIELNSPGVYLKTFSPGGNESHRTSAIEITMKDGSKYSIDNLKETDTGYYYYLGLNDNVDIIKNIPDDYLLSITPIYLNKPSNSLIIYDDYYIITYTHAQENGNIVSYMNSIDTNTINNILKLINDNSYYYNSNESINYLIDCGGQTECIDEFINENTASEIVELLEHHEFNRIWYLEP